MDEKDKISPKDIYESLWRCRDFELSHLWQRSIFLTTFLVMSYTGYGAVILKISQDDGSNTSSFFILNILAILIALVGFVLSILWIMMAKGSKAWYQQYETALEKVERDPEFSQNIVCKTMSHKQLMRGELSLSEKKLNNRLLLNTDAGGYSVSRINIVIGQLSTVVWAVIYVANAAWFLFSKQTGMDAGYSVAILIVALLFPVGLGVCLARTKQLKSTGIHLEAPKKTN